jgi:hypothetical protein
MEHLSIDIICRIADGDIQQNEMAVHLTHLNSCRSCQREVELQRSIVKVSRHAQLINPSSDFAKNVLDAVIPSKKKRWFELILHNLGNIIAMASVLTFLGYIFSITENSPLQSDKPARGEPVLEFFRIIQDGGKQLSNYLMQKTNIQGTDALQSHTIVFALLAIILLVFIDQVAGHFFRRSKA